VATVNLTFTIPDADLPDVVAALKQQVATSVNPNPTQAQAVEALRQSVMSRVAILTKQYRADQLTAGVVAPVPT
jgi:hypothetical protein